MRKMICIIFHRRFRCQVKEFTVKGGIPSPMVDKVWCMKCKSYTDTGGVAKLLQTKIGTP